MSKLLRYLFYAVIVRTVVLFVLGLNVRHRARLPTKGPAIIVANHNSHLDTMVLISLFPLHQLAQIQPVAAADYFLRNRIIAWFALKIIGILPIARVRAERKDDPLKACYEALAAGKILIFFPEGSRGEPEQLSKFKSGIAHLAEQCSTVPVVPIFMHGLGKALPKGEALLVPFFCDVFVGEALAWEGDRKAYMQSLDARMQALAQEGQFQSWD
jgi:1-acyl-sn-glycerol-3-phosphate acyltransferase